VRSDSDLFTFGYEFKPWQGNPVATGSEILNYIGEVIQDDDLKARIHYSRELVSAFWSSADSKWLLTLRCVDSGETQRMSCGFLWMCQGYYRHEEGYTPDFTGIEDFHGRVIHPQSWPKDLDYAGKKVVVIGSGATAATLVPSLAEECSHVTMLQRSPTYFLTSENRNELADTLRELDLPLSQIHDIVRRSILKDQQEKFEFAASKPEDFKQAMVSNIRNQVGDVVDVDKHFSPYYEPGTQRIALLPNGDLLKKLVERKVSIVTDQIERFTESGILTRSGEHIDADIVITATGFNMSFTGDIDFDLDGAPVDFSEHFTYHGTMVSGIPNMACMFGYLRTSWTMRVDLISHLICRLLNHMSDNQYTSCTPELRAGEQEMDRRMFVESAIFNPGYAQRNMHEFPKQGSSEPWTFKVNYYVEKDIFPNIDFNNDVLKFV
jgi:cation diffusion facilitator CzcD-associated flavoprotein CzcO